MLNLDTHIFLYALADELSRSEAALLRREQWSLSAISLWEIAKLAELGRIELDLDDVEFVRAVSRVHIWPITVEICRAIQELDFDSDPADELIAATSLVHNVPLLTRDRRLRRSKVLPLAE
ncbi:MAG: PIN domain-containing protein [Planctomycetota bacterium]